MVDDIPREDEAERLEAERLTRMRIESAAQRMIRDADQERRAKGMPDDVISVRDAALRRACAEIERLRNAAAPDDGWRPIKTARTDGTFVWVWAAPKYGLPGFVEYARYHIDVGWCVDELREVTLWHYAHPPPPAPREGDGG